MRQNNIDLIRILSLAVVIYYHYRTEGPEYIIGTQGVILFFFVSGYYIAMTTEKKTSFKYFWKARLIRLLPVFFLAGFTITLIKMILLPVVKYRYTSLPEMFNTFICVPFLDVTYWIYKGTLNSTDYQFIDGAFWSLLVEFRFYFLFGLFYFGFKLRHYTPLALAPLSLIAIWTSANYTNRINDFFMYLAFFSFGAGYYQIKKMNTDVSV